MDHGVAFAALHAPGQSKGAAFVHPLVGCVWRVVFDRAGGTVPIRVFSGGLSAVAGRMAVLSNGIKNGAGERFAATSNAVGMTGQFAYFL